MNNKKLPDFTHLSIEEFPSQLEELLKANLQTIETILKMNKVFDWDNLMYPLESMEDELERFWSPFDHLHAVANSPELRASNELCLPKLSSYQSAIGHNVRLYEAIQSIDRSKLNDVQVKIIDDSLLSFKLSGVALSAQDKKRFEEIQTTLSEIDNKFENNVLDATQAFSLHITEEARLKGLPEHALHQAKLLAEEKKVEGWILNLEIPCYLAVITYAEDRSLRETFYHAYVTRASDQGPNAHQFDNSSIMDNILALRHEKARLLGFDNYAELSLASKMASSTQQVLDFLMDLTKGAHAQAKKEFAALKQFAKEHFQMDKIEPWDIAYLSEKKQHALFAISQEELRAYFPLPTAMAGLFSIVQKLYGMICEEIKAENVWHKDVTVLCIKDKQNNIRGYIYCDLFARQNKRGGAWMNSCQSRRKMLNDEVQIPVATLSCNFAKAAANKPACLSHDEVTTLFHEFGHCLHHVLTKVDYISASGIHGVEWDAVELPSQFFENFCWEKAALDVLTSHVETQEILPEATFEKLIKIKNFQSAMAMLRQLEFSIFDFRIHLDYERESNHSPRHPEELATRDLQQKHFIQNILDDVRTKTAVIPIISYNRFQHSFTHIFGGGYAAGYYSYKWAEVLSSDAFSRFEEEGIFNEKTGQAFLKEILEVGGSRKAEEAFRRFRGRDAKVDALLRHNGIGG